MNIKMIYFENVKIFENKVYKKIEFVFTFPFVAYFR